MADLFKDKSKDWDQHEMRRQLSSNISRAMIENGAFDEKMSVMDFGAGTGLIAGNIVNLVDRILAVDISESMLAQLSQKEELKDKVDILCQESVVEGIEQRFDRIVSAMALHHVEDTERACQCFYTQLHEGGKLLLADLDKEDGTFHPAGIEGVFHWGFARDELKEILEDTGFSNVHFETAMVVPREGKEFPIFLVTADK
jgi:predicted TPR repeat methyltransferase